MTSLTKSDMRNAVNQVLKEMKDSGVRVADPKKLQTDAVDTMTFFPFLRPASDQIQGQPGTLLKLEGTVQMYYNSAGYYVPIAVFLSGDHPMRPPICKVKPTPEMMIKPNHQHVDVEGIVYLPYLHEWDRRSSLIEMIKKLSEVFSSDPFIFKRPPQQQQQAAAAPPPNTATANASKPAREPHTKVKTPKDGKSIHFRSAQPPPAPTESVRSLGLKGRELAKEVQTKAKEMDELDGVLENSFRCPISMEIMSDPVYAADGHTYEKVEMERWLQTKTTSPLTNEVPSRPVPRPCLIGSRAEKRGTGLVTCSWRTQSAVQRERTGTKKVVVWYTEGGSVVLNSVVNRRGGVVLNADKN